MGKTRDDMGERLSAEEMATATVARELAAKETNAANARGKGRKMESGAETASRPGRRGRPANIMTTRRRQVLEQYQAAAAAGEPVSLARIARACGMYDYRKVRRVIADLRRMGVV
ncbi:hypothetical protein [Sphingomonas colocasiae]|uniref:Helix-turn-helix domain-containing protein n=1 Tax=Sphingomonas colocasiae TaxID=1848973 RepID=A0ABS7PUR7_9SPHN|nr:hypothetical protein [Sphingomonas colocasiae]MBY8825101.1 hypothetical protein [Sphingomonas colocasiae]